MVILWSYQSILRNLIYVLPILIIFRGCEEKTEELPYTELKSLSFYTTIGTSGWLCYVLEDEDYPTVYIVAYRSEKLRLFKDEKRLKSKKISVGSIFTNDFEGVFHTYVPL